MFHRNRQSVSSSPRPGLRSRPATDRSRAIRSAPRCSEPTTGSSRTSAWSPESRARRWPRRPSSSPGSPAWPQAPVRWPWVSGSRCRHPERSTSASCGWRRRSSKRFPDEETDELDGALRVTGSGADRCQAAGGKRHRERTTWRSQVMAREELGIDPDQLGGSPWRAAASSFVMFCLGAVVPLVPFFFASRSPALITASCSVRSSCSRWEPL